MTVRVVKIIRAIYPPDGPWRIRDFTGVIDEEIMPDAWLKEAVGSRPFCYFKAEPSATGWTFKRRVRGQYW